MPRLAPLCSFVDYGQRNAQQQEAAQQVGQDRALP